MDGHPSDAFLAFLSRIVKLANVATKKPHPIGCGFGLLETEQLKFNFRELLDDVGLEADAVTTERVDNLADGLL